MSRTYRANYFARALPGPVVRREKKLGTGFLRAVQSLRVLTNTSIKVILSDMGELRPK